MKKKKVVRKFNFSDSKLEIIGKEKIANMRRDKPEFEGYGIKPTDVDELEVSIEKFSDLETDDEILQEQTELTKEKNIAAENLRVAIRNVMSRVVLVFPVSSPKYKKFGTEALTEQKEAELLVTAKRVFRVGNDFLADLSSKGLTPEMLQKVKDLKEEVEDLIIDSNLKVEERDIKQESRVEAANAIYLKLSEYCKTGQAIWATSNVAKYNDYIIYNTPSGDKEETPTPPAN